MLIICCFDYAIYAAVCYYRLISLSSFICRFFHFRFRFGYDVFATIFEISRPMLLMPLPDAFRRRRRFQAAIIIFAR